MIDLDFIFSKKGSLARSIGGFRLRAQQVEMAKAVLHAIENSETLIAEAGTGTGKTFAYLVPALLAGGKVILSTGTKTLQDQLFNRDVPTVRAALQASVSVALLKGRANYVCHYYLARAEEEGRFVNRADVHYVKLIRRFADHSTTGDRGELTDVPEDATVWQQVTSTRENCLGGDCPHYKHCFVMEARKRALAADLVVVNHHLFFADVVLRDEGVAELLPNCNTVIFDEAHQLRDTASVFFGTTVSTSQVIELARDAKMEAAAAAKDYAPLPKAVAAADKAARDLRLSVIGDCGRRTARQLDEDAAFKDALGAMAAALEALRAQLEKQAERSEGLGNCLVRVVELVAAIDDWRLAQSKEVVRWGEVFAQSLQLHSTPLSVAGIFRRQLEGRRRAWIFTSATLSVKGNFTHYQTGLGLEEAKCHTWDSPFDYPSQGLLYVPNEMPNPNSEHYISAVVDAVLPVIQASRGRAFLLFTSLRAMREVHARLVERFTENRWDFPLLLQGQGSKSELLERFRKLGNAVLVASQSFWEGVDVRGEALSVVMIDRLPFAPPDDPVVAARVKHLTEQGRNAFMEYQVPEAVIALKQGAGRLIRDETDRGVLMICDTRLVLKPYGRRMWQSLPGMRRTRLIADVEAFFATQASAAQYNP